MASRATHLYNLTRANRHVQPSSSSHDVVEIVCTPAADLPLRDRILQASSTNTTTIAQQKLQVINQLFNVGSSSSIGEDDEFRVSESAISIICPYSKLRMRVPVRSTCCSHVECADIDSWVRVLETGKARKDPRGACPTCGRSCQLSTLVVDKWMQLIVDNALPGTHFVMINNKGVVREKEELRGVAKAAGRRRGAVQDVCDLVSQGDSPNNATDHTQSPLIIKQEPRSDMGMCVYPSPSVGAIQEWPETAAVVVTGSCDRVDMALDFSDTNDSNSNANEVGAHTVLQPLLSAAHHQLAAAAIHIPQASYIDIPQPTPQAPVMLTLVDRSPLPNQCATSFNRQLLCDKWIPMCDLCSCPCTSSSSNNRDSQGIVYTCVTCSSTSPKARDGWSLTRVVGSIGLKVTTDDYLLLSGDSTDSFGGRLTRAGFHRADNGPLYYGSLRPVTLRYEVDYILALCVAASTDGIDPYAVTPIPPLFSRGEDYRPQLPSRSQHY